MLSLVQVESSSLNRVGYDEKSNTLVVEFKDHSVYFYHGVSASKFEELMKAESKGKYFSAEVKGQYESFKLDAELVPVGSHVSLVETLHACLAN